MCCAQRAHRNADCTDAELDAEVKACSRRHEHSNQLLSQPVCACSPRAYLLSCSRSPHPCTRRCLIPGPRLSPSLSNLVPHSSPMAIQPVHTHPCTWMHPHTCTLAHRCTLAQRCTCALDAPVHMHPCTCTRSGDGAGNELRGGEIVGAHSEAHAYCFGGIHTQVDNGEDLHAAQEESR